MARTWISVRVELLSGRGDTFWPRPGRIFAVGPSHTFAALADAINEAFARWDRSHLSVFTLADGRVVTDEETGDELANSSGGPLRLPLDIANERVARCVGPGDEFRYVFDLGDDWTHACVVDIEKIDPLEVLGIRPSRPLPYWGWGAIPDQYGRRWADDDGERRPPPRPRSEHPMLAPGWPPSGRPLDTRALRAAVARRDADLIVDVLSGAEIDEALQQVSSALPVLFETDHADAEAIGGAVLQRLTLRGWDGDEVAAEDVLAMLRRQPVPGRAVPVDLDAVAELLGGELPSAGGYLDLLTGEAIDEVLTDEAEVGEDAVVDVESEPDRWLRLDTLPGQAAWQDMADFSRGQADQTHRDALEGAIVGHGAFARFRHELGERHLVAAWRTFTDDRALGRARAHLAARGIRVVGPRSR